MQANPKTFKIVSLVALVLLAAGGITWLFLAKDSKSIENQSHVREVTFYELGVKVSLPESLKDISYDTPTGKSAGLKDAPPIVRLKLGSFTNLANKCLEADSGTYQNFATLTKVPGIYGSLPSSTGENLKQFSGFYTANVGSSLPNGTKCKDKNVQSQLDQLKKSLDTSLKEAFRTAIQVSK